MLLPWLLEMYVQYFDDAQRTLDLTGSLFASNWLVFWLMS